LPHSTSRWARRACTFGVVATAIGAGLTASASADSYVSYQTAIDDHGVVSGYVGAGNDTTHEVRVDVVRNGGVVASSTNFRGAFLELVPQTGDQLVLTDTADGTSRSATVDGTPTFDGTVCGTTSSFSGDRAADGTTDVAASVYYGRYDQRNRFLTGTVTTAGTRFSGTFTEPIGPNYYVSVDQTRKPAPDFTVYSSYSRPVGSTCPAPAVVATPAAAPAAPVADTTKPGGTLLSPAFLSSRSSAYRALLKGVLTSSVSITEPGLVEQTLYLDDGAKLPTATAAAKKAKKAKKLTVLGKGRTFASKAGKLSVSVKLSKAGKATVRKAKAKPIKLALVTTVRDLSGNTRTLPVKRFVAKRAAAAKVKK
jgi:hypothetical protein